MFLVRCHCYIHIILSNLFVLTISMEAVASSILGVVSHVFLDWEWVIQFSDSMLWNLHKLKLILKVFLTQLVW